MDFDFDRASRRPTIYKLLRKVILWILQIGAVILLAYLFVNYGVQRVSMTGDSMVPTLNDGDSIIVNKLQYRFSDPERFDVIVYSQEGIQHNFFSIKRIIGLPGEKVQITEGSVYINDTKLTEVNVVETMISGGLAEEPVLLDDDEYFVLGDNRNNSQDSRFATIGMIMREDIIGKSWVRLSPFGFVGTFNRVPATEASPSPSGEDSNVSPSPTTMDSTNILPSPSANVNN